MNNPYCKQQEYHRVCDEIEVRCSHHPGHFNEELTREQRAERSSRESCRDDAP